MPLPLSEGLSVCVSCLCVYVCVPCAVSGSVLSAFAMLYCHFHVFAYSINAAGPTHTHETPALPPVLPLSPALPLLHSPHPLPRPVTSRFYDFDICFWLLLCMQMTLALMVTQMIAGCCLVTVGKMEWEAGSSGGVTWI